MTRKRIFSAVLAGIMGFGAVAVVAGPAEAQRRRSRVRASAREKGWKAATYATTAASVAALAMNKDTVAAIGAGAALLSYSQWRKEVRGRHRKARYADYVAYRNNWYARNGRGRRR
jgi:hypothetical protein